MLDHDTDSYYKISRAFVDGEPAGNLTRDTHRRQHHAVLADGHRRLGGPVVLGGRTSPGRSACGRPGSSAGLGSGRLHDVPRRDLARPRAAGSRRSTPTSPTSTRSTRAATSPPGRSRSSSRRSCAPRSARCDDRRRVNEKKRLDLASTRQQPPGDHAGSPPAPRRAGRTLYPAATQPPSTWIT